MTIAAIAVRRHAQQLIGYGRCYIRVRLGSGHFAHKGRNIVGRFFRVAPLTFAEFVTTLFFIAALGYFAVQTALALTAGKYPDNFDLLASVGLALIIAYSWLRSVKGYTLAEADVLVVRAGSGKLHSTVDTMRSIGCQPELGSFVT